MELLLNILWFATSAFLVLRQSRRAPGSATLAILCISAVLFPVISTTDDLAAPAIAVEDGTCLCRDSHEIPTSSLHVVLMCAFSSSGLTKPIRLFLGNVLESPASAYAATVLSILSFRAPPQLPS